MREQIHRVSVFLASLLVGVVTASFPLLWVSGELPEVVTHVPESDQPNQLIDQSEKPKQPGVYEWEESFSNEKDIGRRRKNRVEIHCVSKNDRVFAEIEFSSRSKSGEWTRKQTLRFENLNYLGCDAKISDFNNDGFKDLTFRSGQAARGANEIRTLLIYDPTKDELVHVKNSADYPNLAYNKKLNCVDAWAFTATTTTIFLRLEGDMLREFASVSTGLQRIVTVTRKDGTEVILRREEMDPENFDEVYRRFSSYDPPR